MTDDIFALAERVWHGPADDREYYDGTLHEVAPGVMLWPGFGNVFAVATGEGLMLFDTGGDRESAAMHQAVRGWSDAPVTTAVYSHGHIDHVFGIQPFDAEAEQAGRRRPTVVAHEAVPARFDRYRRTAGYNETINRRQFQIPDYRWPREYRYPDVTYRDSMALSPGGLDVRLWHGSGETDDHTYAYLPGRQILLCGDLFIWRSPNAGNPQKVQRYPDEWARALRHMAGLGAELLLPSHGLPIAGAERIRETLTTTAEWLESLVEQTLEMMNAGARLDEIVTTVRVPEHLAAVPYLQPSYDEPEFVVRNVWRLYGGWYDGNPAHLKPAPEAELAAALAELAALAAPDDPGVHTTRAEIFTQRKDGERSTMSRGVFSWAAAESQARINGTGPFTELREARRNKPRRGL